jgi:hypothetical protein
VVADTEVVVVHAAYQPGTSRRSRKRGALMLFVRHRPPPWKGAVGAFSTPHPSRVSSGVLTPF